MCYPKHINPFKLLKKKHNAIAYHCVREPKLLGSLKAQDLFKFVLGAAILTGALATTFELGWAEAFKAWFGAR